MKRRIFALMLSALMIMSLAACNKGESGSPDTGNVKTDDEVNTIRLITGMGSTLERDKNTYDTIISESHPVVLLYYGDENKYPKLNSALEDYNKSEKEYQLTFIDENKDYAKERYLEDSEYFSEFESTVTPYVRRADTVVTSILYYGYEYTGGAHGNYYYYGKNYDTQTGKELTLSDVVSNKEKLAEAVSEQLKEHWSDADLNESLDIAELLGDETTVSWTLDYNGITIYFTPYSIASYASGAQIVTVSNEEYPDVLKAEYKKLPSSYGIELAKDAPFYYDINGDSKVDEIIFSAYESDDEGNPGEASFYINGDSSYSEEAYFYTADAAFIHTKDGKNYIYLELLQENDYRMIYCYDLSDGISKIDTIDGGLRRIYHESDDDVIDHVVTQDALTNPDSFYLYSMTQRLSTATGCKEYYVGNNGVPVSDDKIFTFDEEHILTFTMLQDFEAYSFDEKADKVTGKKTLKSGEEVFYVGTDNEKYAYLKSSNGTLVRVEVVLDKESWRYTINGIDTEEIFDGLFYAG